MFCDSCGAELKIGERFCASCGKPPGAAAVSLASATASRTARHVHLLGILWIAASVLNLIGGAVLFILGNTLFGRLVPGENIFLSHNFLQGLFTSLAVFLVVKAAAGLACGWGLLQHEPWARTPTLVLGFLELLHVPFGTALGIYTIWVLLYPQAEQDYLALPRAA